MASPQSTDDTNVHTIKEIWARNILSRLQDNAVPVPICVACTTPPPGKPDYFEVEYHGRVLNDKELLRGKSGRFIIRDNHGVVREHEYTIVFNYAGNIQNIKLLYSPNARTFSTETLYGRQYKSVELLMGAVLQRYRHLERTEDLGVPGTPNCPSVTTTQNYAGGALRSRNGHTHQDKSHNFLAHTYLHPKWCDHCGEFLWGVCNQGYKCADCNMSVHKLCKDDVHISCTNMV